MHQGIIVLFNIGKGWGFIRETSSTGEVQEWFFHVSNIINFTPTLGASVVFEIGPPLKLGRRDQAVQIRYAVNVPQKGSVGGVS
jgi:cold shock CspA family protein